MTMLKNLLKMGWPVCKKIKNMALLIKKVKKSFLAIMSTLIVSLKITQLSFAGTENMAISMLPERKLLRQNLKMR